MTKQEILDYFKDIDFMYNHAGMHDDLSKMLDKLLENRPKIIHCKDCKYWIPGKIDLDNFEAPRCKRIIGLWESHEYCSCAERKVNQG